MAPSAWYLDQQAPSQGPWASQTKALPIPQFHSDPSRFAKPKTLKAPRNTDSPGLHLWSVFFTAGGWWQLQQARIGDQALLKDGPSWEWCGLRCALTQSVGTVLFNIDTFFSWNQQQPNAELWLLLGILPNVIGSILFLISAAYGMQEVGHGRLLVFEPDHLGWWISIVNALGCVWFMQSAIAGWPTSVPLEQVLDSTMSMRTTLLGSLAFAIVGILSLAECSEDEIRSIKAPPSRKNL